MSACLICRLMRSVVGGLLLSVMSKSVVTPAAAAAEVAAVIPAQTGGCILDPVRITPLPRSFSVSTNMSFTYFSMRFHLCIRQFGKKKSMASGR